MHWHSKGTHDSGVRQTHIVAHFTFHKFLDQVLVPDMPFNLIDILVLLLRLSENFFRNYTLWIKFPSCLAPEGEWRWTHATFFKRHLFFPTLKSGSCTCGKTIIRKKKSTFAQLAIWAYTSPCLLLHGIRLGRKTEQSRIYSYSHMSKRKLKYNAYYIMFLFKKTRIWIFKIFTACWLKQVNMVSRELCTGNPGLTNTIESKIAMWDNC